MAQDADFIMKTSIHNKFAATAFYKYLNTKANRIMNRYRNSWAELLVAYETSNERLEGEGGTFDLVLNFVKSSKNTKVSERMSCEESTRTVYICRYVP